MNMHLTKIETITTGLRTIQLSDGSMVRLTLREIECLSLWYQKYSAKKIGQLLSMSPHTVRNHLGNVTKKFNCQMSLSLYKKIHQLHLEPLIIEFYQLYSES